MTGGPPTTQPALEEAFRDYNRSFRISNSRIGCMLVVTLMPVGLVLDYFVYPEKLLPFLGLRLVCSALALILWGLLATGFGKRHYRVLGMMWFLLPSLFISIMIGQTEGVLSPYYAGLNLVLIAVSWVAQVDFMESVIAVLLTLLMYLLACVFHGAFSSALLFNNLYFIILTGIIVVTGSYFLNRLRYREFALRHELDLNRDELEQSNQKLLEMDRAKSNFFANISHELRTPLTLLIGPLDRLRHTAPGPAAETERAEMLDIMHQNAMRLMRLINDLLNLVRLDSGSLELRPEPVDLRPYLEGVFRSIVPMARERGLETTCEIDPGTAGEARLDRDKVEKIILNLLFNAIKFTPTGGRVDFCARIGDGGLLELEVRDTGRGISPEELPRIFDRFWQAESASNRRYQGVGLGLALVRELARLHGGDVTAASDPGQGTVMRVTLDTRLAAVPAPPAEPVAIPGTPSGTEWLEQLYRRAEFFPSHIGAPQQPEPPPVPSDALPGDEEPGKPSILVADDEPEMMRFLRSQLRPLYRVDCARNGAEAVEIASRTRHHLILLDFMMPEIDGVEATRRLRAMPEHRTVPIIILTARADEESKFQALEAGATDFLTKPFSSTELLARCRNLAAARDLQLHLEDKTARLEDALEQIKQTEVQMVQQAKMATLGQLSAGLLHEINNPLNFAGTALHVLKKRLHAAPPPDPARLEGPLQDLHDGVQRVISIISSLREFTHPDTSRFAPVDPAAVIETAIRFVQINPSEITLHLDVPPLPPIPGNQTQLVHLLINLIQNAADSLRDSCRQHPEIRIHAAAENGRVNIRVQDNGAGIAPDRLTRIFDAFYTTKKVGQGVGLGLSICHRIVEQHRGVIRVESEEGSWCRFDLSFPVCNNNNPTSPPS